MTPESQKQRVREIKTLLNKLKKLHGNEHEEYVTTFNKDEFDMVVTALCLHWSVIEIDLQQQKLGDEAFNDG